MGGCSEQSVAARQTGLFRPGDGAFASARRRRPRASEAGRVLHLFVVLVVRVLVLLRQRLALQRSRARRVCAHLDPLWPPLVQYVLLTERPLHHKYTDQ